jgi:hypothetical protein
VALTRQLLNSLAHFPGAFTAVDLFDADAATPTPAKLQEYDAVLAFSDFGWANKTTLGDVLADFWDAGGGVVVTVLGNVQRFDIRGRWASGGYQLISPALLDGPPETLPLNLTEPGSPLLVGVTAITATQAFQSTSDLINGAVVVARWGSPPQRPFIVRGVKAGRNLVELNMFPPSASATTGRTDLWVGDGAEIMHNSLLFSITDAAP